MTHFDEVNEKQKMALERMADALMREFPSDYNAIANHISRGNQTETDETDKPIAEFDARSQTITIDVDRMKEQRKADAVLEFAHWVAETQLFMNPPFGVYGNHETRYLIEEERKREEAERQVTVRQHSAELGRMVNENRGEKMTNSEIGFITPSWKQFSPNHEYRNGLNKEMKTTPKVDHKAINDNKGKHWQEKFEPESSEYYTRLCDGNYRRIGKGGELPEQIQGAVIREMSERIVSLENIIDEYVTKQKDPFKTDAEEMQKSIARLIDRSTNRYKHEAENYRGSYYREQERKNALITENRELKAEIERLKKTGMFPVEKKGFENLSDREKRFTSIDV